MKSVTKEDQYRNLDAALQENVLAPNCPNCGGNKLNASGTDVRVGFLHGDWDLSTFKLTCVECEWVATKEEAWEVYID